MKRSLNLSIQKKKIILLVFIIMAIFSVLEAVLLKSTYAVKIGGKVIGFVEDKDTAERALQDIKKDLEGTLKKDITFPQEIIVEKTYDSSRDKIYTIGEIKKKMKQHIEISIEAYALNVDGRNIAYLNTKEQAKDILDTLKGKYRPENEEKKWEKMGFVEDVKIQKKSIPIGKVQEKEEVLNYILQGEKEAHTYALKEGDTIWDIMREYDLTLEEIEKSNSNIDLEEVKIGQEITLMLSKPYINVKGIEVVSHEENVPFEIQYETSKDMYQGDSKVIKEGIEGKKRVYTQIEKVNGVEQKRRVLEEETLEEPVMKIVARGIKERPKTMATGDLMPPARGRISSNFGARWGRTHEGIDIAMSEGSDVKAADGGRITFSGAQSGYGNIVIINHENGYETRYAHNSKLLVKAGDRVYKGQIIAKSGNTGRSTGPHLHFEVRKNEVAVDPRSYIN